MEGILSFNFIYQAKELLPLLFVTICILVLIFSTKDNELVLLKTYLRKCWIYFNSIIFMILSKDNKGVGTKKNPNPDQIKGDTSSKKTVIFIRHGESDWNNVFNKGMNIGFIGRLFSAIFEEWKLLFSNDSKFLDSPLNHEGIEQALELGRFLNSENHPEANAELLNLISILKGERESGESIIVSSTLRRAIATTTLSMWNRLIRTGEKIYILSSLQEISRNIDTCALSPPKGLADLPFSRIEKHCNVNGKFVPENHFDLSENYGNKPRSFYGIKRLRAFGEWIFKRKEGTIIVGGHSLWFKYFFQTYLPHDCEHDAKKKKITNSGVVAFTIYRSELADGNPLYRIDPESIRVVYGGFTSK